MNRFYSPLLNPTYEGINAEDYVVATYLVGASKDEEPVTKAASIGIEQTTGSWIDVPAETDEMREQYCSKILGVYEVPDYENMANLNMAVGPNDKRFFIFRIAYPVVNIEDNIPLFLATITGNITSMPYLRLLDVDFPKSYVKKFQGPKFGIKGVREVLGVPKRPLLNNMIKPCTGYTPDVGAALFYEAAAGGVDIIKDDELIGGDRPFNKLKDRVLANMDAARRADAEKGEKTLYACNITDEVGRLKDNAMTVIENGGNCIMLDTFCTGLSAQRMLAEDPDITVPILTHCCFGPALTVSEYQGMSSLVLTKLARLCGSDIYLIEPPYGKFDINFNKYIRGITACHSKFYDLKPAMPFVGGGVIPGLVPQLLDDIGNDVLLGVGAGIHGHPMGPKAGAKAFRVAMDACMNNVPLREAMKDSEELRVAVEKWGIYGEEKNIKDNYLI